MAAITPEMIASHGSEDSHQKAIMQWVAYNLNKYPELKWLHHSPNGGSRDKREGAKFKAMGVKRGFPDLILLVPRGKYYGLMIELKKLKGGVVSDEQDEWKNYLNSAGYYASVCRGWQEAIAVIETYLKMEKV